MSIRCDGGMYRRGGNGENVTSKLWKFIWKESNVSNQPSLLNAFRTISLMLTFGVSMSACGDSASWREEVLLHDGQKIVIDVSHRLGERTVVGPERLTIDETVTFIMPGTNKKITWRMDFRNSVPEPNSLILLVLDIVKGVPYVATSPAGCIAYNKWKRPNPPYVLFKYEAEVWTQISLAEFPAELSKTNVIVGRPPAELLKSFYTVEQVNESNYYKEKEHKTILREAVKSGLGVTSCEVLVQYKCGWGAPGEFNRKHFESTCK
jgi:hypothetical protein